MSASPTDGDKTQQLASLLNATLVPESQIQPGKLDISLARHAKTRHRIAPLLHVLAKQGHFDLDNETAKYLQNNYRHAGMFILQQQSLRAKLGNMFAHANISYLELKGRGLAEQLYDDPAARFSKDIDILIDKRDQRPVLDMFHEEGFLRSAGGTIFNRKKAAIDMWSLKDTKLFDPKFGHHIELHQRPFMPETGDLGKALMRSASGDTDLKYNNNVYILYLILHGAHAHWASLKWILDIVLLLGKNAPDKATELFRLAESYHCTSSVSASLRFIARIFPDRIDRNWLMLADKNRNAKSGKLEVAFGQTLFSPRTSNSMKHAGFPFADWYIYDGAINYFRETPRRLMRPFVSLL